MMVIGDIVMWAMLAALVLCAALWPLAQTGLGKSADSRVVIRHRQKGQGK